MVRKIITVKSPSLRKKSKSIAKIDKKVKALLLDMKETLKAQKDPEGVGLAAPQIGKNLRVFLVNHEGIERVVINPEILETTKIATKVANPKKKKKDEILEGCLSLPHYYGPLNRNQKIKIKYSDEEGKLITEEFTGFMAQIIQHEIDHLDGILFIDRIIEQKSPLYKFSKNGDWEEVKLV